MRILHVKCATSPYHIMDGSDLTRSRKWFDLIGRDEMTGDDRDMVVTHVVRLTE